MSLLDPISVFYMLSPVSSLNLGRFLHANPFFLTVVPWWFLLFLGWSSWFLDDWTDSGIIGSICSCFVGFRYSLKEVVSFTACSRIGWVSGSNFPSMAEFVGPRLYCCYNCRNPVCLHDDIISKTFQVSLQFRTFFWLICNALELHDCLLKFLSLDHGWALRRRGFFGFNVN